MCENVMMFFVILIVVIINVLFVFVLIIIVSVNILFFCVYGGFLLGLGWENVCDWEWEWEWDWDCDWSDERGGFEDFGEGNGVFWEIGDGVVLNDDGVLGVEGSIVGIVGSSYR